MSMVNRSLVNRSLFRILFGVAVVAVSAFDGICPARSPIVCQTADILCPILIDWWPGGRRFRRRWSGRMGTNGEK